MKRPNRPLARQIIRASFALSTIGTRIPLTAPSFLGVLGGLFAMSPSAVAAVLDVVLGTGARVAHGPFST